MVNTRGKVFVHLSTVHSYNDPRVYLKECVSLANAGFDVHLITKDGIDSKLNGVHIHKLKKVYRNPFFRMLFGVGVGWNQARSFKPDIIHIHDPELLRGAFSRKNKSIEVIYDIHEDNLTAIDQRTYIPKAFKSIFKRIVAKFESRARKGVHTIIAESYYKDRFPEAVEILNFPIISQEDIQGIDLIKPGKKLLYTGSIAEDRGALIYKNLQDSIADYEVSLVGKCSKKLSERLVVDDKSYKHILKEGVTDYVPFSTILDYYRQGDWLAGLAIFPPNEHFKKKHLTKFYEYMLYGLPIIYSDFEPWKKLLEPLKVGIPVNPDDLSEIVRAVNWLNDNHDEVEKMRKRGRKLVLEKFNWSKEEKKLIQYYSNL